MKSSIIQWKGDGMYLFIYTTYKTNDKCIALVQLHQLKLLMSSEGSCHVPDGLQLLSQKGMCFPYILPSFCGHLRYIVLTDSYFSQ